MYGLDIMITRGDSRSLGTIATIVTHKDYIRVKFLGVREAVQSDRLSQVSVLLIYIILRVIQ